MKVSVFWNLNVAYFFPSSRQTSIFILTWTRTPFERPSLEIFELNFIQMTANSSLCSTIDCFKVHFRHFCDCGRLAVGGGKVGRSGQDLVFHSPNKICCNHKTSSLSFVNLLFKLTPHVYIPHRRPKLAVLHIFNSLVVDQSRKRNIFVQDVYMLI